LLPQEGPGFLGRLFEKLQIDPGSADPEEVLAERTAAVLHEVEAPAAAVCLRGGSAVPGHDPLLAVALLSRCSDQLFLRRRRPRFDHRSLSRIIRIMDAGLFEAVAKRVWG
jgi:hypothetical protein